MVFQLSVAFLYFREVFLYGLRRVAASDVLARRQETGDGGFPLLSSLGLRYSFLILVS